MRGMKHSRNRRSDWTLIGGVYTSMYITSGASGGAAEPAYTGRTGEMVSTVAGGYGSMCLGTEVVVLHSSGGDDVDCILDQRSRGPTKEFWDRRRFIGPVPFRCMVPDSGGHRSATIEISESSLTSILNPKQFNPTRLMSTPYTPSNPPCITSVIPSVPTQGL